MFDHFVVRVDVEAFNPQNRLVDPSATTEMGFVCAGSSAVDFSDSCVRSFWSALLPAIFVGLLIVYRIPLPSRLRKVCGFITSPLTPFLTLEEAEALDAEGAALANEDGSVQPPIVTDAHAIKSGPKISLWRTIVLVWLALAELLVWSSLTAFAFLTSSPTIASVLFLITSLSWLYSTIRPIAWPQATAPFDLLALYSVHLVVLVLKVGGAIYDVNVDGGQAPNGLVIWAWVADGLALLALLGVLWWCPLGIPSDRVDKKEIVSTILAWFVWRQLIMVWRAGQVSIARGLHDARRLGDVLLDISSHQAGKLSHVTPRLFFSTRHIHACLD